MSFFDYPLQDAPTYKWTVTPAGVGAAGLEVAGLKGGGRAANAAGEIITLRRAGASAEALAAETVVTGETLATATGKSVHANLAAARRASGGFDLVNAPFVDASGTAIQVPKRVNLLTGDPVPNASLVTARPDAARFSNRLILDDKPLGRPLSKDRQEFIRFIEAYRSSQGHLPNTIAVQRYNPATGQPVVTELYTPFDFLPKGPK